MLCQSSWSWSGREEFDIRCHGIKLTITGSFGVEHGAMKPPLEYEYAAEACAVMVTISENILGGEW